MTRARGAGRFTGLIALCTIDLRECRGCCPKSMASRRPFTELASKSDLLRCDTLCDGAREAMKLRYSVHSATTPQKDVFLCESKLTAGTPLFALALLRCGADTLRSIPTSVCASSLQCLASL